MVWRLFKYTGMSPLFETVDSFEIEERMSRQLEQVQEQKETLRRDTVIKALEYSLVGAIEHQGGTFRGLSIQYDNFEYLLTMKASFEEKWMVAHIARDSMINCILSAQGGAANNRLRWKADKFQPSED